MTEIGNLLSKDLKPFAADESIENVQDFFAEQLFSHFPVMEDGVYIGSIAAEDAETFDTSKMVSDYKYSLEGFFVRDSMFWLDVLEVFAKNHTNVVPVLTDENKYTGYYELTEVTSLFHETPFLKESGGILVVRKDVRDYSMGQIVQIVESNNVKLLGAFISFLDNQFAEVTVKVSQGSINELIATFRRYEYEIVSKHEEDDYINNLRERSEYLDRYLNI
ncbi:CBS domain-containing protein [Flavobacterium sp.]|uniref:CBS domain-containing protein n=1 Tax=Flavobacterium sp. TaxID=239 RepID=UPI0026278874|nr:CBS domain-containing protein [Flavobacterium sp.]